MSGRRHSPRFSGRALKELLAALHACTAAHPDNAGPIACWPGVREDRTAAPPARSCAAAGIPVFRVSIEGTKPGLTRHSWAVGPRPTSR